ncbi:MAG: hypothetical protein KGD57_07195, partial [Candidatus Lokiarchaeota archaeon]|nr:hypothetical protein [Candidatus Lokiarchaeota archaeon]
LENQDYLLDFIRRKRYYFIINHGGIIKESNYTVLFIGINGFKEDFPQLLKNSPISGKRILWLCLYGIAMIVRCRSLRWSFIDECLYMYRFFATVKINIIIIII